MLFVWRWRPAAPPWPRPARRLARPGSGLSLSVCLPGCLARLPGPALLLLPPVLAGAGAGRGRASVLCQHAGVSVSVVTCCVVCVPRGRLGRRVCRRWAPGGRGGFTPPLLEQPHRRWERKVSGLLLRPPPLTPHTQSLGVKVLPRAGPGRPVLQGRRAAGGRPCPRQQGGRHWSSYGTC